MSDDAGKPDDPTLEGEGSADEGQGTPDPKGSNTDELGLARKRQGGAEAARAIAEGKLATAERELAKFRAEHQTAEQKDLSELARLQANLETETKRADEAEAKAEARILDVRFPNARKELPEVTDEVRLAKFEVLLAEDGDADEADPPQPRQHNEARPTPAAKKAETLKDMEARVLATSVPEGW